MLVRGLGTSFKLNLAKFHFSFVLRSVPTFVTAHTFCGSRDSRVSYG